MIAPLKGYRIIELGTMITAPLATMMLADMGAQVIKIERGTGDPYRQFNGGIYAPHFVAFNRNKYSLALDVGEEEGRKKLLRLLKKADVFVDNFRPGVLKRLRLTTEDLHEANPRLIHCTITGFGEGGPYDKRPAYDSVAQALSGIASLAIDPEEPRVTGTTISDNVTGMYAACAMLAALIERDRTGVGRKIEVNMLESSVAFMPDAFLNLTMLGTVNTPFTRVSFSQAYVLRCSDGSLIAIHMSTREKFWQGLLAAIGPTHLSTDARFADRMIRVGNYQALAHELRKIFVTRSRDEWIRVLTENDVPFAPVQKTDEVMNDPQLKALGTFRELPMAYGHEPVMAAQSPIHFDGQRMSSWMAAPEIGQHTDMYESLVGDEDDQAKA